MFPGLQEVRIQDHVDWVFILAVVSFIRKKVEGDADLVQLVENRCTAQRGLHSGKDGAQHRVFVMNNESDKNHANGRPIPVPADDVGSPARGQQCVSNVILSASVDFGIWVIAGLNQHEQERVLGALRPLSFNGDHPPESVLVQDLLLRSRQQFKR